MLLAKGEYLLMVQQRFCHCGVPQRKAHIEATASPDPAVWCARATPREPDADYCFGAFGTRR